MDKSTDRLAKTLERVDWMDLWWQMTGDDWPVPDDFPGRFAKIVVDRLAVAALMDAARQDEPERIAQDVEALLVPRADMYEHHIYFNDGIRAATRSIRGAA